ncbi:MAG TPA: hypothetical protein ENF76_01055 [Candidatus Bathyarchaeota archaeon]|nr:hypothetical protein [Candidatus Bathyarchaeota archaeon]
MITVKKLRKIEKIVLVLALFSLFRATRVVSGSTFFQMSIQAYATISSPPIILQNGANNVSVIYANNTSAKISVDANATSTTYTYALNVKNNEGGTQLILLETFNYTGISKINATIGFYDNSTFEKQIIIEGENVTEVGSYYNLTSFSTVHIRIADLEENITDGTAYLHTYLRIRIPNTSTYTLYVITFEFK